METLLTAPCTGAEAVSRSTTDPRGTVASVEPDVLGAPYEQRTIDLGEDDEGPVVATLVRRRAESPSRRAVLYVHGWSDYFFQTHLADFYVDRGWDFYAIDLRKYGRSLLPRQTPNFCRSITEYFPELDEAARIIRADHDTLLVNAHSTGGLITALWAHARRADGVLDGLFLNSPFFDFNASWFLRRPAAAVIGRAGAYRIVPLGLATAYGESLHHEHHGEWSFDLAWKPLGGFPVRAGWLRAIRRGQMRVRAGLEISVPVLVASSAVSLRGRVWTEAAMRTDTVLDVTHMARWAPGLGRHVTLVRFDGGLHDLALSPAPVRAKVFSEAERWIRAYIAAPAPNGTRPTAPGAAPSGAG
jgi:alpha-beta hydrolase superfamily lysophospholipase